MEQFSVKLSGLNQRVDEEQNIVTSLGRIESDIRSVMNSLSFEISSKANLKNILKQLADNVDECESDMKTMRSVLKNVRDKYEKTENRICGKVNDHTITKEEIWSALTTVGQGLAMNAIFPGTGMVWICHEILKDEDWKGEMDIGKFEKKIWEKERKEISSASYEYENGKWVKKEAKKDDDKKEKTTAQKRKDILESVKIWSGSIGKEGSLLHFGKDGDVETEWGKYTYSADVLKAEASASGYVGLGGAGGKVGVSVTALSLAAGGQLGSDMLGAHGSVGVDVGKASAEASADFKWMNEDGKFSPNVGVSGSLEAIAAEASAKVGADILGTEINGKASVNFGIGAHADIGFRNGKFKFDVGASVGVGASVDLEIDVSGTIDAVVEHAQDIGNAAKEAYETVSNAVSEVADAASNAYNNAKDAVSDFAGDVADGWNKGWATVKSGVKGWFD